MDSLLNRRTINEEVRPAASPGTPVSMLTGFGDIMLATDEKPPSVDLVVAKPVTVGDLREAVAQVTAPYDRYWEDDRPAEEERV